MKIFKLKTAILFSIFLVLSFLSFSSSVLAAPEVASYKIDGKQESAKLNPSLGGIVAIEISANIPVKFNTIAICATSDSTCSRTTAVKYFTQTDFASSVSKEWNGKTSKDAVVPDGDYKIKVTMKDESDQENIQELAPYIITIDSNFSGGSAGNSSSESQSHSSQTASVSTESSGGGGSSYYISTHSNAEGVKGEIKISKIFAVDAGRERLAYVGAPVSFTAEYSMPNLVGDYTPRFFWTFGDGATAESRKVYHTYKFPGDHVVILNGSLGDLSAVSRTNIKVLSPEISISKASSNLVELSNDGKFEINLGGWILTKGTQKFVFPEDTIIGAGKKISFPSDYTKLELSLTDSVELQNPSFGIVSKLGVLDERNHSDDLAIKRAKELIAKLSKPAANNKVLDSKKSLIAQSGEASVVKNKKVPSLEKERTASSSVQVAAIASVQAPKIGFVRKILSLPSSGLSLIKRAFYSGN